MRAVGVRSASLGGLVIAVAVLAANRCPADDVGGDPPGSGMSIGINLAGPKDWNTELPTADVFRMSRPWISQRRGGAWASGPALDLDDHGYPRRLPDGVFAESLACTIDDGHYPAGRYVLTHAGTGRVEVDRAATEVSRSPGRIEMDVDPSKKNIAVRLVETDPDDPVRDVHLWLPGLAPEPGGGGPRWNPTLIERWRGVDCVRFMDCQHTNNSDLASWEDRPVEGDQTFAEHGFPIEWLCDLANRLRCDAWFCVPHSADDGFVREMARCIEEHLDADRRCYIEYSNEVWNRQFSQNAYAAERGRALGLAQKPWEAAWRYTAVRSLEVFDIFADVIGSTDRLVRVLPSQSANPYVSKTIAETRDAGAKADVLAIAPYISLNVKPEEAADVVAGGVDGVMTMLAGESFDRTLVNIREQKAVADRFGLKLVAYEAGQHAVGVGRANQNQALTDVLTAANGDPRMGGLYERYLDAWADAGGELMCLFSSVSKWGRYGSWGLMEYADQTPKESPKMRAVAGRIRGRIPTPGSGR